MLTDIFSQLSHVRSALAHTGTRLTNNQLFLFILIKEYMTASRKIAITKKEVQEEIQDLLGFSRSTTGRTINALVKKKCLLASGVRDNSNRFGVSESFRLTMMVKRVDSLLTSS